MRKLIAIALLLGISLLVPACGQASARRPEAVTATPVSTASAPIVASASPSATPADPEVVMPVPLYHATLKLDCETAALRMGLAFYGHEYSEAALFALQQPDRRPPVMSGARTILRWGNPYANFVGDVNGEIDSATPSGYGVYYPVILSIARSHGLPNATGGEGLRAAAVYRAVAERHPVAVWVESGWEHPKVATWTSWDGRSITYSLGEHVVVLTGISGTKLKVNDPRLGGSQYWIEKTVFEESWRDFNNMAVIFS
jgi:uncharacterized protein YvpB